MKTLEKKESIDKIAKSINRHAKKESENNLRNRAFGRVCCSVDSTCNGMMEQIFWLVNSPNNRGIMINRDFSGSGVEIYSGHKTTLEDDGISVNKNTKLGEILIKNFQGTHHYTTKTKLKRINEIDITIHNRSVYTPNNKGVEEIEIHITGDSTLYRFQTLGSLLKILDEDNDVLCKHQNELRKLEYEKRAIEEEIKESSKKDSEDIRLRKDEEERLILEEIKRLEKSINETNRRINSVKYFLRKNVSLRTQPVLDIYQEDAKRSHIYDGVPIVISGGPGTGKTTTVIQRLKFLLDKDALNKDEDGYDSPLTVEQIDYLTDVKGYNSNWLFFSPTELLLYYLRNNMNEEGLIATDENTRTLPKFRQKIMRDYILFDPTKDGPFKNYKCVEGEECLIISPIEIIKEFEIFSLEYIKKIIDQIISLKTSQYKWHHYALRIKSICSDYNSIKDFDTLVRLFSSLKENEYKNVLLIKEELKQLLDTEAFKLKQKIAKDTEKISEIHLLFNKWKKDRISISENGDDDYLYDDEEEDVWNNFSKLEFENQLFSQIKQLLKQLALSNLDSKIKLSKRNNDIFRIIGIYVTEDINILEIGEKAWFVRNFANLCNGVEKNILDKIQIIYKAFRKKILNDKYCSYDIKLLDKILKKDNNKHLHPDEQNLLVGFINNLLFSINKKFKPLFDKLNHRFAIAYVENVKPVIGIDEATDYTLLDYYFMISFRHYDFSSITLSGDIMQGLNKNGICSWQSLRDTVLPNLEVKSLNISYRQLPTLLDMAREMYKDDQGIYPDYYSDKEKSEEEPKPLIFISDDDEKKAVWISNRILDIYNAYNKELPSVAIFVGDEINIEDFIDRFVDLDILNGIEIVDCSGNNALQNKEVVRVFRLSEIKGMEFEAVFFYDIDQAIKGSSSDLIRRFLYVGVSRATSHLAATLCSENEDDIIKYFDTEVDTW